MTTLHDYKTQVLAGLFITVLLLAIGSLVGQGILKTEHDAYERGARAATLHSACRGHAPTARYLERAFRWGDPRSCDDVRRVERPD